MNTAQQQPTLPLPSLPPQPGEEIRKSGLNPAEFLDLCLREQLKEIHLTQFGPTPGHNALWDVRYVEVPKEKEYEA